MTALLSLLSVLAAAVAIAVIAAQIHQWRMKRTLTCPVTRTTPVLGSLVDLARNRHRMNEWLDDQRQELGPTYAAVFTLSAPLLVTCNPANVEHMLKTNFDNYVKGPEFQQRFAEMLGRGIFVTDGQEWYTQRKTAAHMFSANTFREHITAVFKHNGAVLLDILAEAADRRQQVDMQALFLKFTFDSTGEIAFGTTIGSLRNQNAHVAQAFDVAQSVCEARCFDPFWRVTKLLSADTARLREAMRTLNEFAVSIIAQRRKEMATTADFSRKDLLSMFMALHDDSGAPPSDDYLRDVIMNFLIAGRDTTANSMSWATYLLCTHPHVRQQLEGEVDGLGDLNYDTFKQLEYAESVVMETLRLYPSLPKDGKFAVKDDMLPDGTFVPAGCVLAFCPYAMGRSPELWSNPLTFDPLRFYKQPKPSPFKFTAFQGGPRICLGQSMALYQATLVLSMIAQKFQLTPISKDKPVEKITLTLPMRDGYLVTVQRR